MKRYILFGGDDYYPSGGTDDLIGSFDTLQEAQEEGNRRNNLAAYINSDQIDWYNILDTQEGE